jgi:hypothetical protein
MVETMDEALATGTVLGRFRVEEQVGQGAVGTVYRARHLDTGREVAIKVVWERNPQATQRLTAEVLALRRLHHPSIPALLDVFTEAGRICVVREFVRGISLADLLRQRSQLAEREALAVAASLAGALSTAHAVAIIHRDLKPSNVIIPFDPVDTNGLAFSEAKLTDFGAFGQLRWENRQNQMSTLDGEIVGTPIYMAPEQAYGRPQSAATDVYGLGNLLYEMIYGRPPFAADSFMQLILAIGERPIELPSEPQVSSSTRAFLFLALMKREEDRPANGEAALLLLESILAGRNVSPPAAVPATVAEPGLPSLKAAAAFPDLRSTGFTQLDRAPGRRVPGRDVLFLGLVAFVAFVAVAIVVWKLSGRAAIAAVPVSFVGGYALHEAISRRRKPIEGDVGVLLNRTASANDLRRSIAVDVDRLITACREIDQAMMAKTIGILIHEYDRAKKSSDRQGALVHAVKLIQELQAKLQPWYVRHQKTLTWSVALIGSSVGIAKSVLDIVSGPGHFGPR